MSLNAHKMFPQVIAVLMFLPVLGVGQGHERTINKVSWRSEPIKITRLKSKDKPVEFGKKFTEEDDWLRGLTITVENVSNKLISRIELSLSFPRAEGPSETIPTYTVPMGYGRDPADLQDEAQKPVYPGGSVDVRMPDVNLPFIKTDLESLGYPEKITRVEIRVESVTFIDGSMWAGDEILYPDPTNPKEKFNPKFPIEKSRQRPQKSALSQNSSTPRFQYASSRGSNASPKLHYGKSFNATISMPVDLVPCMTVWVTELTHTAVQPALPVVHTRKIFSTTISNCSAYVTRERRCPLSDVRRVISRLVHRLPLATGNANYAVRI